MRILVIVKPRVYREVLALSLHHYRPEAEVLISPPENLDGHIERFKPHMLIYTEGAAPDAPTSVLCGIEVMFSDGLDARISLDGQVTEAKDVGTEDLIALVNQVEKMLPKEKVD